MFFGTLRTTCEDKQLKKCIGFSELVVWAKGVSRNFLSGISSKKCRGFKRALWKHAISGFEEFLGCWENLWYWPLEKLSSRIKDISEIFGLAFSKTINIFKGGFIFFVENFLSHNVEKCRGEALMFILALWKILS